MKSIFLGSLGARAAALSLAICPALGGVALADAAAEKQNIAKCAKDLCSIIASKKADGPDLSCDLTKTWAKDDIQKNADAKNLSWGFGSAKCSVKVSVRRAEIVAAISKPDYTFKVDKHQVSCEIGEGSDAYQVALSIAPQLKFKNGTDEGASLHIADIKGAPLIKGVVWTTAKLEQHFGIFEGDMVREVNKFIQKECPKFLGDAK
jgi:hypothetical protein